MNKDYKEYYITLLCIKKLGIINMFGSGIYLMKIHEELSKKECSKIVSSFIDNYDEILDKYYNNKYYIARFDELAETLIY